jgi:hypothetical protein
MTAGSVSIAGLLEPTYAVGGDCFDYAKGLTSGEISAHLAEIYDASVSKETVSLITDQIVDVMVESQNRPLDRAWFTGDLHRRCPREDP